MSVDGSLTIRSVRPGEASLALEFVRELAEYEKLTHECVATEAMIDAALFGEQPRIFCEFAEWNGEAVGFALWCLNFSTFSGKSGLYLEDLFVKPEARKQGVGKALLFKLAEIARERGYGRMEWSVLDWNQLAIGFYEKLGADVLPDWRICRVTGKALEQMGRTGP